MPNPAPLNLHIDDAKNGFSFVEIIIVLAIFAIVAATAVATLNGAQDNAALDNAQASIIQALEQARNSSASGVGSNDTKHGVRIEEQKIITCEDICDGSGRETPLPPSISTNQTGLDIIFRRITGEPELTQTQCITIEHTNGIEKTFAVTADGRILTQTDGICP